MVTDNQITDPRPAPVPSAPEPFQGFNELKEKTRRQSTELSARGLQLRRQQQGLTAVPAPISKGTGLGLVDTAQTTLAGIQRLFTPEFNLFGRKITVPVGGPLSGPASISSEGVPIFTPTIKTPEFISQTVAQLQFISDEGMDIARSEHKLNWRAHMLEVIPWAVQGDNLNNPLRTTDELISRFIDTLPADARAWISTEDIAFAADILERSLRAMNIKEIEPLSLEASRNIIAQVTRQRSVSIYGMLAFQSDDMVEALIDISQPKHREGTSNEDLRDIVGAAGFESPEVALIVEEMQSPISMLTESLIETSTRYGVLLSNLASLELDDFKAELEKRAIEGLVSRPLVALMLPVDWWRRSIGQPLAGAYNIVVGRIPEGVAFGGVSLRGILLGPRREAPDIEQIFQLNRESMGDWRALGYAFENSNIPAFIKFFHEVMFDPISYFGFGMYAKVARTLPKGIGVPLAGVEEGYIAAVDTAFLRLKSGLANAALKTTNQIVRQETRSMFNVMKAFVEADTMVSSPVRRAFKSLPLEKIQSSLRRAVTIARNNPLDASELTTVGRMLRTQPPVTEKEMLDLGKLVNTQLDLTAGPQLLDINRQLGYTINNGGRVSSVDETAEAIMRILGQVDNPPSGLVLPSGEAAVTNEFQIVRNWVAARIAKSDEIAEKLIDNPKTVKALHDGIFSHIDTLVRAETQTKLRGAGYKIGAMGAGLAHLDVVSKLAFMNSIDRFNRGFARLYLLFAFYAPYNILEAGVKTVYAGMNPFYRGDAVKLLNSRTIGLVGKPSMFDTATGISLELGPLGESLRTARGKLPGMSDKGFRRAMGQNKRGWTKYYDGLQDILIGTGARIGMQQQANFLNQGMSRWLSRNHPEIIDAVSGIIDREAAAILRTAGMDDNTIRQISAEAESRVLTNAKSLFKMGEDFTLDKIQAAHVQKLLQNYTEIGPIGVNHIINMADTDQLFPQLTKVMTDDLPELIYQDVMRSPELARVQMKTLLDELIASPPANIEDLRMRVQTLQYLGSDMSGVIGAQTIATREYASGLDHALTATQKDIIYTEMWDNVLIPFIRESEEQLQTYITQLRSALDNPAIGLADDQRAMFNRLLDRNTERSALVRDVWERYRTLTQDLIAERDIIMAELRSAGEKTGFDAPRLRSWWDKFNNERSSFWDVAREAIYEADAGVLQLGVRLDGTAMPKMVDASGRALTVSDISRLFNSVPADLTRALFVPELGVLTDKVRWVSRIFAQAQDVASTGGRVADDIGFSREAIGMVYDDIIKEMTGSPAVASIVEPRLQQVRGLHNDLVNYAVRKNSLFTPKQTEAINRFSNRVLESVEDDTLASRVLLNEPDTIEGIIVAQGPRQMTPESMAQMRRELAPFRQEIDDLVAGENVIREELQGIKSRMGLQDVSPELRNQLVNDITNLSDDLRRLRERQSAAGIKLNDEEEAWRYRFSQEGVTEGRPGFSWLRERQKALDAANRDFTLNFPDYTNETAINAIGRGIFPFWTYETHRLFWLARSWIKTPGTLVAQGKFQDYTDQGYIHIPGTSWEINPLRGTIWMGGMRRLLLRDFPEYYDRYPGLSNAFDWASRFGFYPNIMVTAGFALHGAATGQHQLGEILPPIPQTLLEAYIAANPDSTVSRELLEKWFPSRFRDYLVQQAIGELGGPGVEINDKRYAGTPLNEEEEQWWARGQRKTSLFNFLSVMTGLLRMRPEERKEFDRLAKETIEECTGVPVQVQERAAEVGMRLSEWIPPRPECRDLVQQLEGFTRWRGLASHLRESEAGQNLALQRLFWSEIETEADATQEEREAIDRQWLNGQISQSRYEGDRSRLRAKIPQLVETKRADARFQLDIDGKQTPMPMTMQEKQDFADKLGFDPVFMAEEDELAAMYYQLELKDIEDEDTGQLVKNWELFFAQRRAIEQGVTQERAQLFYERLHKRDTKLDRFRRLDYDTYIRPYQQSYNFVLNTLPEDEQIIVKREAATDDEDVRQELLAQLNPKGRSVVADFKAELSRFKINMRKLDPELDARIMLWKGRAAQSDAGLEAWRRLRERYGFVKRDFDAG